MSHIELERQAMNLSAQGRAELAHKLLSSLKDLSEAELEQLWVQEETSIASQALGSIRNNS